MAASVTGYASSSAAPYIVNAHMLGGVLINDGCKSYESLAGGYSASLSASNQSLNTVLSNASVIAALNSAVEYTNAKASSNDAAGPTGSIQLSKGDGTFVASELTFLGTGNVRGFVVDSNVVGITNSLLTGSGGIFANGAQLQSASFGGTVASPKATISSAGAVVGTSFTDGTATMTAGALSGVTTIALTAGISGGTTCAFSSAGTFGTLAIDTGETIGCDADGDIITLANQAMTIANDVDFNVAKTSGLQLGGIAVTSTAAELNLLDTATAGVVVNNKAVIYNAAGLVQATSVTATAAVTGDSITDGTAEMSSGALTGVTTIGCGAITSTGAFKGTTLSGSSTVTCESLIVKGTDQDSDEKQFKVDVIGGLLTVVEL